MIDSGKYSDLEVVGDFDMMRSRTNYDRVINKNGRMHRYRWGSERKKAILGWEASRL